MVYNTLDFFGSQAGYDDNRDDVLLSCYLYKLR